MPRPVKYHTQEERLQARREQLRKNTRAWRDRTKQRENANINLTTTTKPPTSQSSGSSVSGRLSPVNIPDDELNRLPSHNARFRPTLAYEPDIVNNYDINFYDSLANLPADVFDLQLADEIGYSIYPEDPAYIGDFPLDPMLIGTQPLPTFDCYEPAPIPESGNLAPHDEAAADNDIEEVISPAIQEQTYGMTLSPRSSPAPFHRQPGFFSLSDVGDEQKLDFFLAESVRQTNAHTYSQFWSSIVMQGVRQVKAIEHAVLALAEVHWEYYLAGGPGQIWRRGHYEVSCYAMQKWRRAVKQTRDLLQKATKGDIEAVERALVACALFVKYHSLIGDYMVAHTHLQAGLALIAEHSKAAGSRRDIQPDIVRIFKRCETERSGLQLAPPKAEDGLNRPPPPALDTPFYNHEEARDWLFAFGSWLMTEQSLRVRRPGIPPLAPYRQKQRLTVLLTRWLCYCEELYLMDEDLKASKRTRSIMQLHHASCKILIAFICSPFEKTYDSMEPEFVSIVNICAVVLEEAVREANDGRTIFSLDIGLLFPLFLTAGRCRITQTRQRALDLLRCYDIQEGGCNSYCALLIGEATMAIEESKRDATGEIPEEGRVSMLIKKMEQDATFVMSNNDMSIPTMAPISDVLVEEMPITDFVVYGNDYGNGKVWRIQPDVIPGQEEPVWNVIGTEAHTANKAMGKMMLQFERFRDQENQREVELML